MVSKRSDVFGGRWARAAISWAIKQPVLFASLGPADELGEPAAIAQREVLQQHRGHLIGFGSGFLALSLTNAWGEPNSMR